MEEIVCCLGGCVCTVTVVCLVVTARAERSDSRTNRTGGREGGGGEGGKREGAREKERERVCMCVCVRERGGECNNNHHHNIISYTYFLMHTF